MKALIAMSGGVDSSVAALLMGEHERVGCTMRLFDADDSENITVIMNENGSGFNRIIAPIIIPADQEKEG